jgi:hypothetical protein
MKAQIRIFAGLLLAAAAVVSAPVARAIDATAGAAEPVLELRALTGPQGGTLTLELVPAVRVL